MLLGLVLCREASSQRPLWRGWYLREKTCNKWWCNCSRMLLV